MRKNLWIEIERKELIRKIREIIPTAIFDDEYTTGEIMIATGLKNKGAGFLSPMWEMNLHGGEKSYNMDENLKADKTIRTRSEISPE